MKNVLLLLSLMVFISSLCFGQGDYRQGYIIKPNGDSVSGFVGYRGNKSNYKSCLFKESKKGKKVRYNPSELRAYGITDDRRFESKRVEIDSGQMEMRFIEIIIKGAVSLYSYKNTYFVERDSLVKLPKNKTTTVESERGSYKKEDKRYIGILNYMLSDCRITAPDLKYQEEYLTGIIHHYNECKGNPGIDFKSKKPWAQFDFQVFAAEDISQLQVDGYGKNTYGKSYSPTGGVGLDFSTPRAFDKFFFTIEAWYVKKVYQGYVETSKGGGTTRTDLFVNTSSMKFPIGVKYNFLHRSQTPYIKFGFVQYLALKSSKEAIKEQEFNGEVVTDLITEDLQKVLPYGFWFGAGFTKYIRQKLGVFGEVRVERNNGIFGTESQPESSTINLNVIVGMRF